MKLADGHSSDAPRRTLICAIGLRTIPNGLGGIETHCENLYPRVAALREDVEIVALARSPYCKQTASIATRVRVVPVWSPRHKILETLLQTPIALFYARFRLNADVVHLHALGPAFFTALAKILGFKTIVTHHARDFERPKWRGVGRTFLKLGEATAAHFADRIICVSRTVQNGLTRSHSHAAARTYVIRNGVSAPAPSGNNDMLATLGLQSKRYVLAVGRLDEVKGFDDIVAAFKRSAPRGQKLVIVGDTFVQDAYAKRLKSAQSDTIIFAGFRTGSDLWTLYRNASLLVHPSRMEGYSLVVVEAIAAGIPILISDLPVHREFDLPESCYFPIGDVDALAHRLQGERTYAPIDGVDVLAANNWDEAARKFERCVVELTADVAEKSRRPLAVTT